MASGGWISGGLRSVGLGRLGSGAVAPPVAGFTGTPTTGTAPLVVAFTDTSTGTITSEQFDPGDGSGVQASVPAFHTYLSLGTYSPSLTVIGPGGTNTLTRTDYITVTGRGDVRTATWNAGPTPGWAATPPSVPPGWTADPGP